jgi:hypothetical protein
MYIPDPGSRVKKIPAPGSASNNLSILTLKTGSKLSEKIIWDVHPGSESEFLLHPESESQIPNPDL